MKITTNTIAILKNFAKINPSILIPEGNTLRTISPSKTIMAKATVDTTFPQRFAVYNLDRFLSTLSLFPDPDLEFGDRTVVISDGKQKISYVYAEENTITKAPEKEIVLPSEDVKVTITEAQMRDVEKAASILGMPELLMEGDGTTVRLQAADSKNPSGDTYSIDIGSTDSVFKAIFKIENIKTIPGDYDVTISSKGISHFRQGKVEYYIAVEQSSSF